AEEAEPECMHIYFTACAGNLNAGKYTDLTAANMRELGERLYRAMVAAGVLLKPEPLDSVVWTTTSLTPEGRIDPDYEAIEARIHRKGATTADRNRNAFRLTWLRRCEQGDPLTLGALHLNAKAAILHLPGEVFVEYQLAAQQAAPGKFVAVAAYGDDGPWYLPTSEAYPQGGYEVSVAFCEPGVDRLLRESQRSLLES
ncbi:MAG: hypothetical protein KDN18_09310, partial [Verrucomicrobiae bacterium]|nr:hypothetical protein [Verrucomicrobiae bacterium]